MSGPIHFDVDFARSHFPLLQDGWALFENAGGTLAARPVVERLTAYASETMVQPGGPFDASELAAERIAESQRLLAEMINAAPDEVMIGPSTTMNVYLLAQALRSWFKPGDEIVVTNLDHEANNGAWRRLAEQGVVVREWRFEPDSVELEPAGLDALLTERTRLVCVTHCSNITGSLHDVAALARKVHAAGALICIDGVAYAPHRAIDVKAWDVDFYLCSLYKFYGPHLGLLYGKREHLLRAKGQNHFFIGEDDIPLKLNPGGVNHELTASASGIAAYFESLFRHHFKDSNLPLHARVGRIYELIARHEERIVAPFIEFLTAKPKVRIIGRATADRTRRVPTVSFVVEGRQAASLPDALRQHRLGLRSGDFYAARLINDLGLAPR
ncbi:MAG: aminotransferase class V-fold PLP-dependent enzyme, partial [Kiloniellales bacterium]